MKAGAREVRLRKRGVKLPEDIFRDGRASLPIQ